MFCMRHLMHVRSPVTLLPLLSPAGSAAQVALLAKQSGASRMVERKLRDAETINAAGFDRQMLCRWHVGELT
jgi:hypothetical protein